MKNNLLLFLIFFYTINFFAQDSLLIGKKYFEDQIYTGFINNFLVNKPNNLQQRGISTGLQVGFIKDIPLNKQGSFALGFGLGYAYNRYNQNIQISSKQASLSFIETQYTVNRLSTHSVEFPFEVRFRLTSSPTVYKFWRLYIGGKIEYTFYSNAVFKDDSGLLNTNASNYITKLSYGSQVAIGYNAFNIYIYYPFTALFQSSVLTDSVGITDLKSVRLGLQFYIF